MASVGQDTTPPTVNCPQAVTSYTQGGTNNMVSYPEATASDNSGGVVTITYSTISGSNFQVGNTTVTVTATDQSNNSDQCTFTVTVIGMWY